MIIVSKDISLSRNEGGTVASGGETLVVASVSEAVSVAKENETIKICPGEYFERVTINKRGIKIIGEDAKTTKITYNLGAFEILDDGEKRGTFRSYSVLVDADDVYVENLTIENSAGDGREVGQTLALYSEGDRIHYKNCRFLAHQDTIFTGPLPPMEKTHKGFVGPKEFSPRINGRQWFENCYIEGDVDFIFGSATALFTDCLICSLNRNMDPNGYVTAPSTPQGQTYGYIFKNCDFVSEGCGFESEGNHLVLGVCESEKSHLAPDGFRDNSVYLSRPWREYAKCIFINCSYGPHIKKEGLHDWNNPDAHDSTYYAEYPMVEGRVDWMHELENPEFYMNLEFEDLSLD